MDELPLHCRCRYIGMVCDTEALLGNAPITDTQFFAPALYCFEQQGAGVYRFCWRGAGEHVKPHMLGYLSPPSPLSPAGLAIEVCMSPNERMSRIVGNLVVAPDAGRPYVTALHM